MLFFQISFRAAVAALAKRHADGSLPVEDYNIELEDQRGQKVNMGSETDQRYSSMHVAVSIICTVNLYNLCDERNYFTLNCLGSATCALYLISDRAIMMGLMLHSKGKQLIRTEQYRDALEVLHMGEVSSMLAHVSKNCSNLQIDFCCRVLPFH